MIDTDKLTKQIVQATHIVETYQKVMTGKDDFVADEMKWVSETLDAMHAEIKRLKQLINRLSDMFEEGLCYSDAWWATDDFEEQEAMPLGGLKIADSGVDDWPNVHFDSKKIAQMRALFDSSNLQRSEKE